MTRYAFVLLLVAITPSLAQKEPAPASHNFYTSAVLLPFGYKSEEQLDEPVSNREEIRDEFRRRDNFGRTETDDEETIGRQIEETLRGTEKLIQQARKGGEDRRHGRTDAPGQSNEEYEDSAESRIEEQKRKQIEIEREEARRRNEERKRNEERRRIREERERQLEEERRREEERRKEDRRKADRERALEEVRRRDEELKAQERRKDEERREIKRRLIAEEEKRKAELERKEIERKEQERRDIQRRLIVEEEKRKAEIERRETARRDEEERRREALKKREEEDRQRKINEEKRLEAQRKQEDEEKERKINEEIRHLNELRKKAEEEAKNIEEAKKKEEEKAKEEKRKREEIEKKLREDEERLNRENKERERELERKKQELREKEQRIKELEEERKADQERRQKKAESRLARLRRPIMPASERIKVVKVHPEDNENILAKKEEPLSARSFGIKNAPIGDFRIFPNEQKDVPKGTIISGGADLHEDKEHLPKEKIEVKASEEPKVIMRPHVEDPKPRREIKQQSEERKQEETFLGGWDEDHVTAETPLRQIRIGRIPPPKSTEVAAAEQPMAVDPLVPHPVVPFRPPPQIIESLNMRKVETTTFPATVDPPEIEKSVDSLSEEEYNKYVKEYYENYYKEYYSKIKANGENPDSGLPPELVDYYKKYYENYFDKESSSTASPVTVTMTPPPPPPSTRPPPPPPPLTEIDFPGVSVGANGYMGISDPRMQGQSGLSGQQVEKLCTDIERTTRSFGITDLVAFVQQNCPVIQVYYRNATCAQIERLVTHCQSRFG